MLRRTSAWTAPSPGEVKAAALGLVALAMGRNGFLLLPLIPPLAGPYCAWT